MTAGAIQTRASRRGLLASAIAWVWPQPLRTQRKRAGYGWMGALAAWLWPSRLEDERFGRRHGLMALLFGWMWPQSLDRGMQRWWRTSWLWSWIWPGRVMGPHGEICPLAPWHPAARPIVVATDPWRKKVGRHSGALAMMMAATAIAAPTFMEGDNVLDGGRLNLFRGGAAQDGAPSGAEQTNSTDGGAPDEGVGEPGGGAGGDGAEPGGDGAPAPDVSGADGGPDGGPDGGLEGALLGGTGGPDSGEPGGEGEDSDPNTPTRGDDLTPDPALVPGGDSAGGGVIVGGGSGGGGGGGSGGGGQPTNPGGQDPNDPGGDPNSPFTPSNPPTDKPVFPTLPGGGGPSPGGGPSGPATLFNPDGPGGDGGDTVETRPAPVPEPAAWAMMILGFGLAGYAIRRRSFVASIR